MKSYFVRRSKLVLFLLVGSILTNLGVGPASALTSKDKSFIVKVSVSSRNDLEDMLFNASASKSEAYRYLGMVDNFTANSEVKNEMVRIAKGVCARISSKSSTSKSQTETFAINYINSIIESLPEAGSEEEYVDMMTYIMVTYYSVYYAASKYGYCANQSGKMKSVLSNFDQVAQEKIQEVLASSSTSSEEIDPSIDDTVSIG